MSDAIKAEIKKLEDRRFQAMIDSDFDTLDKLLGDDLIYTHSTAQSDTRAEYIALCKKGVFKYLKIERPIENIQVYGDTVVVTGRNLARSERAERSSGKRRQHLSRLCLRSRTHHFIARIFRRALSVSGII